MKQKSKWFSIGYILKFEIVFQVPSSIIDSAYIFSEIGIGSFKIRTNIMDILIDWLTID